MNDKKPNVKSKVEAIIFSSGHKMSLDEISKLARSRKEDVLDALKELQKEYDDKQSSLMLVDEGESWKFTVRDHLISVVRKIVTETELTKSVLETLAVIAFKYPILQADLIKIRTNKAYDHLVELENAGYITRQKHSRTNLIKLTEKFFKYFDLTEDSLRDKFKDFSSIAQSIKEKEEEVKKIKDEQKKRAEELGQQDEKIKQEIESLDSADEQYSIPLENYEPKEQPLTEAKAEDKSENKNEALGDLDVVDVNQKKEDKKADNKSEDIFSEESEKQKVHEHKQKKQSKGIVLSPEDESKAEQKAEDIIKGRGDSSQ